MKLIDLLVKILPGIGGWPDDCIFAAYQDGYVKYYIKHKDMMVPKPFCLTQLAIVPIDFDTAIVTRDQYQSALAASQKAAWNGDGLPPVGVKCRIIINDGDFGECEILFVGESLLVWRQDSTYQEGGGYHRHMKFRPIRTEADKKRDEIAVALIRYLDSETDIDNVFEVSDVIGFMDYVASGKIPGVKLED